MGSKAVFGHMKKAHSNLESAQMLFDNGMYEVAVSSSYYAVFHAVSALLASKDMEFSKHKTVINKYNEEIIHTGLISSISFRSLTALFRLRLECEYDPILFIEEDGAKEALKLAQAAVQDILDYCQVNNISFECY
ncbi:MAG: HEPN domain-containing protein [Defluviitaleaceae bacterium]|nr:HEPN domain-containing protein [Defluviitaleaceae bacterium]